MCKVFMSLVLVLLSVIVSGCQMPPITEQITFLKDSIKVDSKIHTFVIKDITNTEVEGLQILQVAVEGGKDLFNAIFIGKPGEGFQNVEEKVQGQLVKYQLGTYVAGVNNILVVKR